MGGFFLWRIWCIAFMDFLVWLWRGCVALQVLLCLVYGGDIVCSCGDDLCEVFMVVWCIVFMDCLIMEGGCVILQVLLCFSCVYCSSIVLLR